VILVDFRGLDTLGEIAVVMTAGIAVLALLRKRQGVAVVAPEPEPVAEPRPRRSRKKKPAEPKGPELPGIDPLPEGPAS
jgi:multicomponent Na+:H+ antiporter subunit A